MLIFPPLRVPSAGTWAIAGAQLVDRRNFSGAGERGMRVQRDRRRGGTAAVRAAVPVMKILLLSSVVTNASRPRGSSGFPAAAMAGMRRLRGGSRVEEATLAGDAPVETAVASTPPLYRELPLGALAATASGTGGREDALLRACAAKGDVAGMASSPARCARN